MSTVHGRGAQSTGPVFQQASALAATVPVMIASTYQRVPGPCAAWSTPSAGSGSRVPPAQQPAGEGQRGGRVAGQHGEPAPRTDRGVEPDHGLLDGEPGRWREPVQPLVGVE